MLQKRKPVKQHQNGFINEMQTGGFNPLNDGFMVDDVNNCNHKSFILHNNRRMFISDMKNRLYGSSKQFENYLVCTKNILKTSIRDVYNNLHYFSLYQNAKTLEK